MSSTTHREESTANPALYVPFELGSKEWLLTMSVSPSAKRHRARVKPGDRRRWWRR